MGNSNSEEKTVSYTAKNTYVTLNRLSEKTKNVWIVFHGMGFLSRYFVRNFSSLNPEENYIIAPQAPSKYYLKDEFKYVGASWLTRENTVAETENVLAYVDEVFREETIPPQCNFIIFGFSQGVSIALRWMVKNKIDCDHLILYAGGIPYEIQKEQLDFMNPNTTKVKIIYGTSDEYLQGERLTLEERKMKTLFDKNLEVITFDGAHEMKSEIIQSII